MPDLARSPPRPDADFRAARGHAHAHLRAYGDAPRLSRRNRSGARRRGPAKRWRRQRRALRALVYGANDALFAARRRAGRSLARRGDGSRPGACPTPAGSPSSRSASPFVRTARATDGAVVLDYLRWDGPPDVRLRRPDAPGDFWRRAWVNAVERRLDQLSAGLSSLAGPRRRHAHPRRTSMDRLSRRDRAHGSSWPNMPASACACRGLRRYYAVLLVRPDRLRLVRVRDGEVDVLAESAFAWSFETPYAFVVEVVGRLNRGVGRRRSARRARRKPACVRGRRRRVDHPGRRVLVRLDTCRASTRRPELSDKAHSAGVAA